MLDPNKIKKKVLVNDFITTIRKYAPDQIEDSGHAFKRLSQRQREIFTIEEMRNILLRNRPFLVGIQQNANYAVFYNHQGKNLRMIINLEFQKVKNSHFLLYIRMADTKNMMDKERILEAEGEMDYDYVNDILLFKIKDREYNFSIEFQNMVIDIDNEKFIVGIQIFDASKFLKISKEHLRKITKWQFKARLQSNQFRIDLYYQIVIRNKTINNNIYPIIVQQDIDLPSPQTVITI